MWWHCFACSRGRKWIGCHTNEYANIFSVDLQYQNENVCVGILTHTNITYQWHSREKDLFFCHRRAEGLLVFHGFTSMHTKMWTHNYWGQDGLNYLGGGRLGEHKCNTNNLSNWYLFKNTLHTHTYIYIYTYSIQICLSIFAARLGSSVVLSTGDPCGQRLPTFRSDVVEPCQRLLAPGAPKK